MEPSPLYSKLLSLSKSHAVPYDLNEILSIRAPDAIHAWGHNYLLSRSPGLRDRMDNAAFKAHILSTSPYLDGQGLEIHDIIIDTVARKSAIHMSYFLTPKGSKETVENNLLWVIKFTTEGEVEGGVDGILIKESVEFIDPTASARVGTVCRELHGGKMNDDVRGGLTLKQDSLFDSPFW
ncbi:hypothetical protein DFH07DRAFT_106088 [Mycena maculata]|uniref:Uncharacterized protein n=1 Tax=Mycena maculata TaxID=230809 RepID=A0AAD7K0X2_9AGAR|nr:hypothetical protein DFH07DRAFT_106088 [Mycena maculata]